MAAVEFFRNVMQAMRSKHSKENIILKGLHKKKDLGDSSQPEKTWFVLAKEQVSKLPIDTVPVSATVKTPQKKESITVVMPCQVRDRSFPHNRGWPFSGCNGIGENHFLPFSLAVVESLAALVQSMYKYNAGMQN